MYVVKKAAVKIRCCLCFVFSFVISVTGCTPGKERIDCNGCSGLLLQQGHFDEPQKIEVFELEAAGILRRAGYCISNEPK